MERSGVSGEAMTSAAAAATTIINISSLLALVTVAAESKIAVNGAAAMFVGGEERGPMTAGTVGVGSEVVRQVGLTASSQGQVVIVAGDLGGSLGEVADEQVFAVGAGVEDVAAAVGGWSFICRCCSSQARCIGRENGDELVQVGDDGRLVEQRPGDGEQATAAGCDGGERLDTRAVALSSLDRSWTWAWT